ncbi:MAG: hypothetical protein AYK19_14435, partial [Theionarchaea archaeon DG-70-1]
MMWKGSVMIVVHAIWNNLTGQLHIWAESSTAPKRKGKRPKNTHPFALPLYPLLKEVERFSRLVETADSGNFTMVLPSTSKRPLPSPELVTEHVENPTGLNMWEIPAAAFDPYSAFDFLLSLPDHPPHGVAFGSSLRFWVEAAKFLMELITRKCFAPTIKRADNGFHALWEVVITDAGDERMRVLSQVMPPVCRAFAAERKVTSMDILLHFLNSTVDAFVRNTCAIPFDSESFPGKWVQALAGDPYVQVPKKELKTSFSKISSWLDQIKPDSDALLRLCFKLNPPEENDQNWILSYHLQAKDDKSLLIPAEKIWRAHSQVTIVKRTFENPQERLLTDLGRASRLYPAIEKSLKSAHPAALRLTTRHAYSFLREAASLMEQSGFGVLLPPWWQKTTARPGVKLRVKSVSTGTRSGLFGIGGILAYDWRIALGGETISLEEFKELAQLKVPLVKVRGKWVELNPEEIEKAIKFFEKYKGTGEMMLSEALRLGLGQEQSEVGLPVVDIEGEGEIKKVLDDLINSSMSLVEPPHTFRGILRPYQVKGVSWLTFLNQFGLGACLADDMGLGKTIQVIALLLHERNNSNGNGNKKVDVDVGPTLVVCPMSVVGNWYKEVERFAPSLKVMVHHGTERLSRSLKKEVKKYDMVITTYALAYRDESYISSVDWERIILDEAQNIKNPAAKQTQAIKRLSARQKVALTGTPVENRLSELWSIMDFLNKGYLGSQKEFKGRFGIPIERHHSTKRAEVLKLLIQPFVLRRLKTDKTIIKDLPEKMEMKVFCNLTKEQVTLYEAVVQEMLDKIEESEGIKRKGLVLSTLMKLKQVCNHPAQFLHDRSAIPDRSGKLTRLKEMLDEALSEGDKALIFTQFREMGGMLQEYLQEQLDCETLFLHGGTTKKKRDVMIDRFQSGKGPPLFVLSLKAGGLGLNLTEANQVFHFDRWWNPAVENQATDRAFRIGQKKNVFVHKFVCIGTLEERIDQLIEQKKELADTIVGSGEDWITE